eukprot:TRINITY_DN17904_c0_g1_i2.p2 TRINITY_DN17904_c0_g1~~TRINITY_DN17904_c0_g1_i2.p2  ORF type:complete len:223 (+),score=73.07 TRINITY_DN17904_c0_g1_i2:72-740(+)
MHAAFWLLVAAGAASGKLIDDLQGQWAVTEIDVGAMAKEMRNTDDIRPEDDIEFTRGGFVDLNGTSLEKTGRATIGKVGSFQELNVVVESAKKSKVATITFLEPGEDDNIDADSAALPYLTLKAKTEPFNNGKLSTRRYASRVYGEGQAQVFFHNDKSFYVALHPDAGGSVATRSLWFARGDEEPSAWDQWRMHCLFCVRRAQPLKGVCPFPSFYPAPQPCT